MGVTRRDFLKIAGATAGGGIAGSQFVPSLKAMEKASRSKETRVPVFCEMCHWTCGALATVRDGKVVKLEGNPLTPNSRGKLCGRGNGGIGLLYDPDRVKTPLIRAGNRGDGKYKKASWDEALNYVAEKLEHIKKNYGPEAVSLFSVGSTGKHLLTLVAAYGSLNFAQPSGNQCRGAREVGYILTYGDTPGSPERLDLANSKVIVLFGSHLGENMHNSQVQDFANGLGKGAKLIVVDPRFSTAAGKAHYWLPIKPGTDMALILAWTNILIREGLYDKAYVDAYCIGFNELAEEVSRYTPEWAEKETEIPAGLIVETALEIGRYKPSVMIHPGRHSSWYGDDVQRSRAMAILGAVLGTWGREGGIYLPTKASMKKVIKEDYPEPQKGPIVELCKYPFAIKQGLILGSTTAIREATLTEQPYPVKGWIVLGANVVKAMPNEKETLEAINKLDLLLTIEIMPLETAMVSDVILPSASYLEQAEELEIKKGRSLFVTMGRAAVPPMYESKDGYTIAREIAKRIGVGDFFPWETLEEKNKFQCQALNLDYEELSEKGCIVIPNTDSPYITPENQPVFKTPSKKIELYSAQLAAKGFDPIPKYTPPEQPPEGHFRLVYGRSPVLSFTRSCNNPILTELHKENSIWVNAGKARELGIKDGQYVVLENQDGVKSNKIRAKVTQRIREDCVYMVHGFGSELKGLRNAYRKGADDQGLITRYSVDPISGATGMRVNFVKILKEV